jgi:hypothetical protein
MKLEKPPAESLPVLDTPSETIQQFWELLQQCWDRNPQARPSILDLQDYIFKHKYALIEGLDHHELQLQEPLLASG